MWDALLSEGALAIVRVALTLFDKVRNTTQHQSLLHGESCSGGDLSEFRLIVFPDTLL